MDATYSIPNISAYLAESEKTLEDNCSSDYLSAPESFTTNKSTDYFTITESDKSGTESIDHCNLSKNGTYFNFLQIPEKQDMSVTNIDNIYQTLVQNTYVDDRNNTKVSENSNCSSQDSYNDYAIVIGSSEDESDINETANSGDEEIAKNEPSTPSVSFEMSPQIDTYKKRLSCIKELSGESKINCTTKNYESASKHYSTNLKNEESFNPDGEISIPNIDFNQFDFTEDSFLDNTLDRINAMLEADNSTSETEFRDKQCDESLQSSKSGSISIPPHIISASFLQKQNKDITQEVQRTPVKNLVKLASRRCTPEIESCSHIFKTPSSATKSKIPIKQRINLKEIVSPVGMYIKHSPQPVLRQNVHSVEKKFSNLKILPKKLENLNKENTKTLPNVIYKPSKNKVIKSGSSCRLPDSLNKMIGSSEIIKHDRLPLKGKNTFHNHSLDNEAELTQLNDSETGTVEDISILQKKFTFKN